MDYFNEFLTVHTTRGPYNNQIGELRRTKKDTLVCYLEKLNKIEELNDNKRFLKIIKNRRFKT